MIGGFSSVADIGSQTQADGTGAEQFYKARGVERYAAYDIDGKHGAFRFDFNTDLREADGEEFDLVVNNGTAEHIFHIPNVFESCHNMCNREGAMVHVLPWVGWLNHGFFSFQPCLFRDLAAANGYTIEGLYAADREGNMLRLDVAGADPFHHPKSWKEPLTDIEKAAASFGDRANIFIAAILRQAAAKQPFVMPIQGKYAEAYADYSGTAAAPEAASRPLIDVSRAELVLEPFPHMVVSPALPEDYYQELLENWLRPEDVIRDQPIPDEKGNVLMQRSAKDVIGVPDIPPVWRRFFMDHTSPTWFAQLVDAFDEEGLLKPFFSQLAKDELQLGIRGTGSADVLLDCQFAVNTPSAEHIHVRGPHLDSPGELLAGMLYMPIPGDSQGGNLYLYSWKEGQERQLYGKAEANPQEVVMSKCVQYERNTAIFFLNGQNSLHGVSHRLPGPHHRRYINFLVEGNKPWFEMPPHAEDQSGHDKFCRLVHRRKAG